MEASAYGLKAANNSTGTPYGKSTGYAGRSPVLPVVVTAGTPLPHDCHGCCWALDYATGDRWLKYICGSCPAHEDLPWTEWKALPVGRGNYMLNQP
jgi:hypothetical protein